MGDGERGRLGDGEALLSPSPSLSPSALRPPDGQAFARVEDPSGLDIVNDFALLAELVHGPGHADPGHQLLLSGVFNLTYRDVFPLAVSALTNLLGPQPVSRDVGPQAVIF